MMLELLSKDLIAIVDRYLVDYWYSLVKQQYKDVWLNEFENTEGKIYWDPSDCDFETFNYLKANWRDTVDNGSYITKFYSDHKYSYNEPRVPKNYL